MGFQPKCAHERMLRSSLRLNYEMAGNDAVGFVSTTINKVSFNAGLEQKGGTRSPFRKPALGNA